MEEIKKVINRLKEAAELCMSSQGCSTCIECEYKMRCVTNKNADIIKVMEWAEKKLESTDDVEKNEAVKPQIVGGIKGERDEALLNLYKQYNRLTALEEVDYATSESMHILIDAIEKLEHARHMESADEIARMAIEKLDKLAAPIPEVRMSGIPKEYRTVLDKCGKKEGAKNDD